MAITRAPRAASDSRIAWARAAPSSGSVPAPSSSRSTSERSSAAASISRTCVTNAENVERCSATLWSSPTMANTPSKTGRREPSSRRHVAADLGHEGAQRQRLEGHRLAARVRAGDQEQGARRAESSRSTGTTERCGILPGLGQQQRMAGGAEERRPHRRSMRGRGGAHALGACGARRRSSPARRWPPPASSDRRARSRTASVSSARIAADLLLLLARAFDQLVVGLDHRLGLDEDRLRRSASGRARCRAGARRASARTRNHVAAVPQRDEAIRKRGRRRRPGADAPARSCPAPSVADGAPQVPDEDWPDR